MSYKFTLNVLFTFNNRLYKRTDGVAMGSPLGPLLADVFVAKLEQTTLSKTIEQLDQYVRYVDDTFVVCSRRLSTRNLLKNMNKGHQALEFTLEEERDDRLAFLDVEVIRRFDDTISTRMHHKSTLSLIHI